MRYFKTIFFFSVVLITASALASTVKAYPNLVANNDLVSVAPYNFTVQAGAGNLSVPNYGAREFFVFGRQWRMRQSGEVKRIKMYIDNKDQVVGLYVKFWRQNASWDYDLVGTTENLVSVLTAGEINEVNLTTPVAVQEGDFYSVRVERAGAGGAVLYGTNASGAITYYTTYNDSYEEPSALNFPWEEQESAWMTNKAVAVEFFMNAPQTVFIGDSIVSGAPSHHSFLHTTGHTNIPLTIEHQLAQIIGYDYQNMGIGSQTSVQIAARFAKDVVNSKPRLVIVNGGINDMALNVSVADYLTSWQNIFDLAAQNNIKVAALLMLPCSTNLCQQEGFMDERDMRKQALRDLATEYDNIILVDGDAYVGQYRPDGPAGNYWDIKPEYDCGDHVHFSPTGYAQIAQAIADALLPRVEITNTWLGWQRGQLNINYNLFFADDTQSLNLVSGVEYSLNGVDWLPATEANSNLSDGYDNLFGSTAGQMYTFVWHSWQDVANLETSAYVRLRPNDGYQSALDWVVSGPMAIDNLAPSNISSPFTEVLAPDMIKITTPGQVVENGSGLATWQMIRDQKFKSAIFDVFNTSSTVDSDLLPNTCYNYQVHFTDQVGNTSVPSETVQACTLAPIPTRFVVLKPRGVNNVMDLSVKILPNVESGLSGYYFFRADDAKRHNSGWIKTNHWRDTGFAFNVNNYTWGVKYRNAVGEETAPVYFTSSEYPNSWIIGAPYKTRSVSSRSR